MDPRRVLTFRAVAHERSFSAAARSLALTQPAVSQQVAALEKEVGARLLDREPGGLRLTAAGEVLLAHADAIAERFALAERQLAELTAPGPLRIGAFPSALAGLVPHAAARLARRGEAVRGETGRGEAGRGRAGRGEAGRGEAGRGEAGRGRAGRGEAGRGDTVRDEAGRDAAAAAAFAEVVLEEGSTPELAERVRRGELHLAVGFQDAALPRREHEGVVRLDLVREPFMAALPPDHPLAALDAVPLSALADEPWVAPSGDNLIARACRAAGFEPRLVMLSRDPLANRALVAQGLAVTITPRMLGREFSGVALRPLAGDAPQRDLYVLLPPGGRHPRAEDAWDALVEVASALS